MSVERVDRERAAEVELQPFGAGHQISIFTLMVTGWCAGLFLAIGSLGG